MKNSLGRLSFETFGGGDIIQPAEEYGMYFYGYEAAPPRPRLYRIDVEGRNGSVDMTEWAGETFYQDRTVTVNLRDRHGNARALMNRIMGRLCKIRMPMEFDGYFFGRCEDIRARKNIKITEMALSFTCHPFLYPDGDDDYAPSFTGQAYSGHRVIALTAEKNKTFSATRILHQAQESPLTVTISGLDDGDCYLSINGTVYAVTEDGTQTIDAAFRPGENGVIFGNAQNTDALSCEITFKDQVI